MSCIADYTVAAPFDLGECTGPYCTIMRMDRDGSNRQRVAQNVRNAAGYTWHPGTGELLFTGMERDGMGGEGKYPQNAGWGRRCHAGSCGQGDERSCCCCCQLATAAAAATATASAVLMTLHHSCSSIS